MPRLFGLILIPFLGACTFSSPLSGPGYTSGQDLETQGITEVVVSLTEAETRNDNQARTKFWSYIRKIDASLETQEGLIASSKRTEIFGSRSWTMTVWKDRDSLRKFLASEAHVAAANDVHRMVQRGRFATFVLAAGDLPLDWQTAEKRLATDGREMTKYVGQDR